MLSNGKLEHGYAMNLAFPMCYSIPSMSSFEEIARDRVFISLRIESFTDERL